MNSATVRPSTAAANTPAGTRGTATPHNPPVGCGGTNAKQRWIWWVFGDDTNVFGAPKHRKVEVVAVTRDEARAEALRLFPTMTITDSYSTGRPAIS